MFAALYIPDFPLEAIVRAEPGLREQALAVLDGKPPVLTVLAVNERARALGVEPGMTELQASTGVAGLTLRRRSSAQEVGAHAALLDTAQAFSPCIEDTGADTVVLDLAGLELLFGAPLKIARDLARRASDLGLEAHAAVASNPDAAVHAARGFPGITVIPPGKEAERLGELPVDVLFAGGNDDEAQPLLETLDRWGVRTFHALATLPEIAVSERLGQNGLRWQKLARGAGGRPLLPAEPPLQFVEVLELEHPVAMLEPLAFLLGRLLEQVCARLGARALATNELRLALFVDDVSGFTFHGERENDQLATPNRTRETVFRRALRLPVPMLDSRVFLKLLQLDLKAHPPPAPVVKIEMAAEPVRPQQAQGGLFLAVAPEPDRLELTLARIAAVLRPKPKSGEERPTFSGEVLDRVGSAELLDTHRPDAFRMVRFAPPAPSATAPRRRSHGSVQREDGAARDNVNEDCSKRPTLSLRRFRPPLPAKVEQRQDRPVRLWTERSDIGGEVVTCSGPWRTSGDWWEQKERGGRKQEAGSRKDSGQWNREEWDVVIGAREGVALYRIYCDLASGRWFVEASYD